MKKTFRNLFLAVGAFALAATGMTSCNNNPDPDDDPIEDKYNAAAMYQTTEDLTMYRISLADKTLTMDEMGNVSAGSGNLVTVMLFSSSTAEPAEGEYPVVEAAFETPEDGAMLPGLMDQQGNIYGSNVLNLTDGAIAAVEDILALPAEGEGSISLSKTDKGWKVIVNMTLLDGTEQEYAYEGALRFVEYTEPEPESSYDNEPTETTNVNITFTQAGGQHGAIDGVEAVLFACQSNTEYGEFIVYPQANAAGAYDGTYTINDTKSPGTAQLSIGGIAQEVQGMTYVQNEPCYVLTGCQFGQDGSMAFTSAYYLESGSITVNMTDGLTVNAKSHFGSTINATYSGALSIQEATGMPEKVKATDISLKRSISLPVR